eukprot:6169121-Amphidinium_carterae.1
MISDQVVTKSTTKSTDPVPDVNLESAFPKLAANAKAVWKAILNLNLEIHQAQHGKLSVALLSPG